MLQPAYAAQAVYLGLRFEGFLPPRPASSDTVNYQLTGTATLSFTASGGGSLGSLGITFNCSSSATYTSGGTGIPVPGSTSITFTHTSPTEPGPVAAINGGDSSATWNGGAGLPSQRQGSTDTVVTQINTPTFLVNLPFGATVTANATFSVSGGTVYSGAGRFYVSFQPHSSAALSTTGVLTASALVPPSPYKWESADAGGGNNNVPYTVAAWDAFWLDGTWKHATSPAGNTATFQLEWEEGGPQTAYVRVTNTDGFIGWASAGATTTAEVTSMGALSHPSGALYLPGPTSGNTTSIVRFNEGAAPQTLGSAPLKSVHLMRHEGLIYAGGVPAAGGGALYVSEDEATTFTMLSAAFPSNYKACGWCELWGGGFAAIATLGTGLYAARSLDGVTWSAPLLVYAAPSGTPKGAIRQMMASGESHILISDTQNYCVRSDDMLATAGTRLY